MRKRIIVILILISIFPIYILSYKKNFLANIPNIWNNSCSNQNLSDPYQKGLATIPPQKLYYYSQGSKIFLKRFCDENSIYFKTSNSNSKIKILPELMVSFKEGVEQAEIDQILNAEKLQLISRRSSGTLFLGTTPQSRFSNGLQEANYLYETYPQLINFATPNWIQEGSLLN